MWINGRDALDIAARLPQGSGESLGFRFKDLGFTLKALVRRPGRCPLQQLHSTIADVS